MKLLDLDYIELERRRAAQLAALQWHAVTNLSKRELRHSHLKFVSKIYLASLLCIVLVVTQWKLLLALKAVAKYMIIYYYVTIGIVFVHFLILTLLQYVLKVPKRPRTVVVIYAIIIIQLGSVTIASPVVGSDLDVLKYSTLFCFIMWVISFGLAVVGYTELDRTSVHLSLWSQKYYLTTAVIELMNAKFDMIDLQLSVSLVMIFFISIFFVVWGRGLGALKFYRVEKRYCTYYIVLTYLNLISLFANTLLFMRKLEVKLNKGLIFYVRNPDNSTEIII